ncbi:MAG: AraC-like DNA-binding protein, partial [Paraglaciecola sp.]
VAIRQLHEGQAITNVALNLDYGTTSAFTFMFRTKLGKTPSQFFDVYPLYTKKDKSI